MRFIAPMQRMTQEPRTHKGQPVSFTALQGPGRWMVGWMLCRVPQAFPHWTEMEDAGLCGNVHQGHTCVITSSRLSEQHCPSVLTAKGGTVT